MKKVIAIKNGEEILIRHVRESDTDGVWNNFNEVVDEGIYLPVFFPVRSQFEKQNWYNTLKRDKEICIVAINPLVKGSQAVIGQCEISNLEWDAANHVGRLGIIVKKEFRDLGIGYHLIDVAIRESRKLNYKEKIILSSFLNNERALKLYQRIGFKEVGVRKRQFYMEGKYYDEILMELWIDDYLKNSEF